LYRSSAIVGASGGAGALDLGFGPWGIVVPALICSGGRVRADHWRHLSPHAEPNLDGLSLTAQASPA
jgi:hypothetical protein